MIDEKSIEDEKKSILNIVLPFDGRHVTSYVFVVMNEQDEGWK